MSGKWDIVKIPFLPSLWTLNYNRGSNSKSSLSYTLQCF